MVFLNLYQREIVNQRVVLPLAWETGICSHSPKHNESESLTASCACTFLFGEGGGTHHVAQASL